MAPVANSRSHIELSLSVSGSDLESDDSIVSIDVLGDTLLPEPNLNRDSNIDKSNNNRQFENAECDFGEKMAQPYLGKCTKCGKVAELLGLGDAYCGNPNCESDLCAQCVLLTKKALLPLSRLSPYSFLFL